MTGGTGSNFKLYGIIYDPALRTDRTLKALHGKMKGKLHMLYRMRHLYSESQMMTMYKAQMLSSVEWCTAAIFHCTLTALRPIDSVQRQFLRFMGIEQVTAFLEYNLAPLSLRWSIAILGFIYKCVMGLAPSRCCSLFPGVMGGSTFTILEGARLCIHFN